MQVIHGPTGMPFDFPDGTPDEQIQGYFRNADAAMPTPNVGIAQQFLNGVQDYQQQEALTPAPPPISGRGYVGLDPQQAQFMLQQRQQQQAIQQRGAIEGQRNRLQEQQMLQQSIESEKDRSFRIKEFQSRLKNQQDIAKLEAKLREDEIKQDAMSEQDRRKAEKELAILKHEHDLKRDEQKFDRQEDIAQIRAAGRGNEPRRVVRTVETRAINPETGKEENVLKEYFSDGTSDFIPMPAEASSSDYKGLGVPVKYFDDKVNDYTKLILDEQAARYVDATEENYISPAKARGIAKMEVEAELAEAAGYEVWRAPDGTPYWAETEQ